MVWKRLTKNLKYDMMKLSFLRDTISYLQTGKEAYVQMKKLGFGLMRLPMLGDEVDIEQVKQMVDLFLERGFTYFDTAYGYIGGKSE